MEQFFSADPIRAYIESRAITQKDFAKLAGVSDSAVSQWLAGTKGMDMRTAARIEKRTKREIVVRALFPKFFERST